MLRRPYIRTASPVVKHSRRDRRVKLTARQLEIALLMADGLSSREIAARIDVTKQAVEFHRSAIHKKIGLRGTALLVRWLIRERLLKP